jgi:hypothetical protein
MNKVHLVIDVSRWLLGLLLLWAAFLLREDEEGRIQNRLEEFWINLMYTRDSALTRAAIFMRGTARLANRAFDTFFGKRLWSVQAVGCILLFFVCLMLRVFVDGGPHPGNSESTDP